MVYLSKMFPSISKIARTTADSTPSNAIGVVLRPPGLPIVRPDTTLTNTNLPSNAFISFSGSR